MSVLKLRLDKRIELEQPSGDPVADADGGFTQEHVPLTPARVWAAVEPAAPRTLERLVGGAVSAEATHLITIARHPDVDTSTRVRYTRWGQEHVFAVTSVQPHRDDDRFQVLTCTETVR